MADGPILSSTTASCPQIVFTTFLRFSYLIIFNFDLQIAQVGLRRKKNVRLKSGNSIEARLRTRRLLLKKENPRWYELVS
jgi:hypothetical protein